jgi:hypothetical protein
MNGYARESDVFIGIGGGYSHHWVHGNMVYLLVANSTFKPFFNKLDPGQLFLFCTGELNHSYHLPGWMPSQESAPHVIRGNPLPCP